MTQLADLNLPAKPQTPARDLANQAPGPAGTVQARSPAALALAALLSACGGGEDGGEDGGEGGGAPQPALGLFDFSRAVEQPQLLQLDQARSSPREMPQAAAAPTAAEFMDWAEMNFAPYFPPHQADIVYPGPDPDYIGLVYRLYPSTGNYLIVWSGLCFVWGPLSAGQVALVGGLSAFPLAAGFSMRPEGARFLLQAQLSASDADIAAVQRLGYAAWLEQQFAAPVSTTGWDWLLSRGYNDTGFTNSIAPADYMVWNQLITSPDALRKRVALALSEIFVVSGNSMSINARAFAMAAYWDMLNAQAFGNYRQLLEAVTLNPAMGVMLNTRGNQKENPATGRVPDENYGREVMQLMSIGLYLLQPDGSLQLDARGQPIPTYDQNTVTEIARVFTGWNFDTTGASDANPLQVRTPMRLFPALHSTLASSFLGTTVPAGTDGATALRITLDTLARHPNVGPFLGRQLIARLVTSNPSKAYVARVSAAFDNNGVGVRGDLKAVLRAILLDPEARGSAGLSAPDGGKLREPMLRFVQWARTFGAASPSGGWQIGDLSNDASRLGQSPLRSPSVFNFFRPGYVPPNTVFAASGLVAPEFQITNESTVAAYTNYMQTVIQSGVADVKCSYSAELPLANTPDALLARLNLLLAAGQLSAATLSTISAAVSSIAATTAAGQLLRVQAAVLLVMACPQYLVQK